VRQARIKQAEVACLQRDFAARLRDEGARRSLQANEWIVVTGVLNVARRALNLHRRIAKQEETHLCYARHRELRFEGLATLRPRLMAEDIFARYLVPAIEAISGVKVGGRKNLLHRWPQGKGGEHGAV
jgi:hypothetical protein